MSIDVVNETQLKNYVLFNRIFFHIDVHSLGIRILRKQTAVRRENLAPLRLHGSRTHVIALFHVGQIHGIRKIKQSFAVVGADVCGILIFKFAEQIGYVHHGICGDIVGCFGSGDFNIGDFKLHHKVVPIIEIFFAGDV